MKILTVLMASFLMGGMLEVQAYQAAAPSRPQFGTQHAEDGEESSVPGANSRIRTRTFSNYGSRQQWGRGVETKTVQTEGAAIVQEGEQTRTAATDKFSKSKPEVAAGKAKGKLQSAKKDSKNEEKQDKAQSADAKAAQPAEAAMPAEMANVMQQMQGMQDMMKMLGGGAGGGAAGAATGMPAGMNIPGMPDMSSLMNAAAGGQQPAKK
jgi:hypothetical protein